MAARRLGALASSLLDGLAVWSREIVRPENEQSPTTIRHKTDRARRMIDLWEMEIDHPVIGGKLNLVQIRLTCALGLEVRNPQSHWRPQHPKLCAWFECMAARPSFVTTTPPIECGIERRVGHPWERLDDRSHHPADSHAPRGQLTAATSPSERVPAKDGCPPDPADLRAEDGRRLWAGRAVPNMKAEWPPLVQAV
jgi:hypothetical protein